MAGTKIVATIGPSSFKTDVLEKMYRYGLSCIRINTAHIEAGYIAKVKETLESLNRKTGMHVGIMVDLKGPELRTGTFPDGHKIVKAGQKLNLTLNGSEGDITLSHPEIAKGLEPKETLLLSDGRVRMRVLSKNSSSIQLESLDDGDLRDRSRVNIPGKFLPLGTLTERDKQFLQEGISAGVEFFAQSFVQRREDVMTLQKEVSERGGDQLIVSKIETKSGYVNIKEISRVSDFVMVARGDLGVELPLKEVAMAQKHIIEESHKHGVPAIVATQMLESMVNSDSPTRAEVSDVTNAILDDTDALMLSEETAMGKYPVEAVTYLYEISKYVESQAMSFPEPENFMVDPIAFSVAKGVKIMSSTIDVSSIIALTISGHTAKIISAIRPVNDIYAVVQSEWLARSLNLMKGVIPVVLPTEYAQSEDIYEIISKISPLANLKPGEKTIVVSGSPSFYLGGTNNIRVLSIGTFMGRGYPAGRSITGKIDINRSGSGNIIILDRYDSGIDYSKYDAAIVKSDVTNRIIDTFMQAGKTLVYNTEFVSEIKDGSTISIDADTGIITCI